MDSLWIAFLTGLTSGGLSCMAVQGGLVTGSLARQIESDLGLSGSAPARAKPRLAFPILLFLIAKLAAHTLFGFFLGWLGSAFALSPIAKGVLQIAIAIFMLGNALRMLNIHPIFRYFSFEPPSFVTRYIRRRSKQAGDLITPLTLGALTIFIPCGITQSMFAAAIATGSPAGGAALLFAYILGTGPVFFALTYLATRLSALLEKYFYRIVAAVLFILALVGLDNGLNMLGSPVSLRSIPQAVMNLTRPQAVLSAQLPKGPLSSELKLTATNDGYFPEELYAPAGEPLKLHLITDNTTSCALEFTIPAYNISVLLDPTGDRLIELPPQKDGDRIHFSCSMGMYVGDIFIVAE